MAKFILKLSFAISQKTKPFVKDRQENCSVSVFYDVFFYNSKVFRQKAAASKRHQ